ncbi:unnamed protein product [Ectocarpus sp. 12 AP-2014]
MSSRVAARQEATVVPVQATERAAAAAAPSEDREGLQQIGFDDALFLLVAEGRRPHRKEMIVFCLGFAASLSLVFITSDLMNGRRVHPGSVIIFVLSVAYCGVLIRRQRIETARLAGKSRQQLEAEEAGRRRPPGVLDKETRRRLLNYFVLRPPEEKNGDNNHKSGSGSSSSNPPKTAQRQGDIGGSGRGIRFPKLARVGGTASGTSGAGSGRFFVGVFSPYRAPASGSPPRPPGAASPPPPRPPPPPPYASPPPRRAGRDAYNTAENIDQERAAADFEEGLAAASAALASDAEPDTDSGTRRPAGGEIRDAAAAGAAARSETDVVMVGASVGEKAPGAGDEGSSRPRTDAGGVQGEEAKGEGSTGGSCIVCFGDYTYGEELCRLRCGHLYHAKCIDEWLDGENHGWCPLCKTDIISTSGYLDPAGSSSNNNAVRSGITGQGTRRWGQHMPNNIYTGNDAA